MTVTSGSLTLNFNGGALQATGASATFLGASIVSIQNAGGIINNNGNAITIVPVLAHGGSAATDGGVLFKGSSTTTLNSVNTYTGTTLISAGTLQLGIANAIPNGGLTLSGGTLASAGFSDTLGPLSVTASSAITLGTTAAPGQQLTFSTLTYSAGTLTIDGWQGTAGTNGAAGQLLFPDSITAGDTAASANAAYGSFLSNVTFTNNSSFTAVALGGTFINSTTTNYLELVPAAVPEPQHLLLLSAGALLGGFAIRRRWRKTEI